MSAGDADPKFEYADVMLRSVEGKRAALRAKFPAASLSREVVVRASSGSGTGTRTWTESASWVLPPTANGESDVDDMTSAFEGGAGDADGKRLVVRWVRGREGVDVAATVLCETAAFKLLTKAVGSAAGERAFVFGGSGGADGGGAQVRLAPLGTLLVCFCLVTMGNVVVKRETLHVVVP